MESISFVSFVQFLFVIQTYEAAQLPKYQALVYPEVFDGRDEYTKLLKINDEISLNLEPSSVLHENFFVRSYRDGVAEHQYYDVEALQKNFYHDKRHLAAVILSQEDGTLQVEGVIGPNLKIRPTESAERSEHGRRAHLIESIEEADPVRAYGKRWEDVAKVDERAGTPKTGFDSTKYNVRHIYPEIFVVCDTWFHSGFRTNESMIEYLMVTFEVVNIRYSLTRFPNIQLVLMGIELSHWKQEHKYYKYVGGDDIDGYASLLNLVTFLNEASERYRMFDLVYFATGYDMVILDRTKREESLGGYAFVASACTDHRVQLGEDRAHTYKGIRTTAHEVAHTLGCSHDGTSAPGVAKAFTPDSLGCPWEDGYIMSYKEEDSRSMKFSSCCQYDMRRMSWSYEGACLHINNTDLMPINWKNVSALPGTFLTKDLQCRLTYPELYRTRHLPNMGWGCRAYCSVPGYQFGGADYYWPMYLIDGSPCESYENNICLNGDCVRNLTYERRQRRY
uniref:Reprolysin n=1 Tax=Rhipicephalus zambeziensis TaxID=60191 RepID=A0A224YQA6_9ACAR